MITNKSLLLIFFGIILLVSISPIVFAQASAQTAVTPPKTVEEIMRISPTDFVKLTPSQAIEALNKLAQTENKAKINELFNKYAKERMGLNAAFQIDVSKTKFSSEGLNAPNGNFLEFESLKTFITSKKGQAVSITVTPLGFEITTTGSEGEKSVDAQGFSAITFKEGKIQLDGNLLDPDEGDTTAVRDAKGVISIDGQGTMKIKGGKSYEFEGKSTLSPDGKILVLPDANGNNWVKVEGQRIIPKDAPIAVYTDASKFKADKDPLKVLISIKDGRVIINPVRQPGPDGIMGGTFEIGRSIKTIGDDGKPVIQEEIATMSPSGTTIPTTQERTYDSLFAQLQTSTKKKATYLIMGRNNDPYLVDGIQKLLGGIDETTADGMPIYGERTKAAIEKFQDSHDLDVDGKIGPDTYKALSKEFNNNPSAVIAYTSVDGGAVLISDNGVSDGATVSEMIKNIQNPSTVTRGHTSLLTETEISKKPYGPELIGRYPATNGVLKNNYGAERAYGAHNGEDIAVPVGTPVTTPVKGIVIYAKNGNSRSANGGYGGIVQIWDPVEHTVHTFAHNSKVGVSAGDQVDASTVISLSGNTGNSRGPHIHWTITPEVTSMPPKGQRMVIVGEPSINPVEWAARIS